MNALHFHTGNRMETLVEKLAELLATPDPFRTALEPEVVIVQSLGMSRWCSQQLALRHGVCLNVEFPFPRAWLRETLSPWLPAEDPFAPDLLGWRIFSLLPTLLEEPGFEPVQQYVADGDTLKLYQLATRLGHLFDQYLTYRPFLLLAWEQGEQPLDDPDARWQARLWQSLNREHALHLGGLLHTLRATPMLGPGPRLSIFGISSLPPAQTELFFHIAASRPVHLFLLSPSNAYFGDDLTPRQRARLGLPPSGPDDGNPLLTSLGRLHAYFTEDRIEISERLGHRIVDASEAWHEPTGDTLLSTLQRDLFHAEMSDRYDPTADDASLSFHACHSPMREVEILYDQLLALFEADPTLHPGDILVMAPDIETYAPLIHAVFGFPEDPALRIPFSIADRHPRSEHPEVDLFLRLLELPGTRCTGPQLFSLMESGVFREQFGFDDAALEQIHHWTHESGIRWGFSAHQREELGLPPFEEATWRQGLDRLLLGYAMTGRNERLFEGILPCDDVEGSAAEWLGSFITLVERLERAVLQLSLPHSLSEWATILLDLLDQFFPTSDAIRPLREMFAPEGRVAQIARLIGDGPLPLEIVRAAISDQLGEQLRHGRFLTGGVTFCALKPMRSIPARVIWLLGMDDGAFPRRNPTVQFDLITRYWERGDRSPRDDDRYLFLEALLSARDRLGISYLGRSQQSNEEIPPSVVVGELLDYLASRLPDPAARQRLVTAHGLQAFSPLYYEPGTPLWSYSKANAVRPAPEPVPPFASEPLPLPPEAKAITIPSLLRFFAHPTEAFLERRLGLPRRDDHAVLEESEPLSLPGLERYKVRDELLAHRLRGTAAPSADSFRARALLPPGALGDLLYRDQATFIDQFHDKVAPWLGPVGEPEAVRLALAEEVALSGLLPAAYGGRLLAFRPARVKSKDRLRAWLLHLIRATAAEERGEAIAPTLFLGEDDACQLTTGLGEAKPLLEALVAIYLRGLQEPLPFFPLSSWEYATRIGKNPESALRAAAKTWEDDTFRNLPGEGSDSAHRRCFPGVDVIGSDRFCALAEAVYGPLLAHQQPLGEEGNS